MSLRKRYDHATELRAFARDLEELADAGSRDQSVSSPLAALAQRMQRRAAEVMRHDDPTERGTFRADTVFGTRKARPVRTEIRGARRVRAA